MRLRISESNAIADIMSQYKLSGRYNLVKRRGWVFLELGHQSFQFHRKNTQELIDGKFQEREEYFVKNNHEKISVQRFDQVMNHLEKWIKDQC